MGARRNLLERLDHLLSNLPTGLQHCQENSKKNGEYCGRKNAGERPELRPGAGSNPWIAAVVKNDGQRSGGWHRQQWRHQAKRHHYDRDECCNRAGPETSPPLDPAGERGSIQSPCDDWWVERKKRQVTGRDIPRGGLRQSLRHSHANLRRSALRAEGLTIFDEVPAFVAGMVH